MKLFTLLLLWSRDGPSNNNRTRLSRTNLFRIRIQPNFKNRTRIRPWKLGQDPTSFQIWVQIRNPSYEASQAFSTTKRIRVQIWCVQIMKKQRFWISWYRERVHFEHLFKKNRNNMLFIENKDQGTSISFSRVWALK